MKEKCCNNTKNAVQLRKEEMKKILIGIKKIYGRTKKPPLEQGFVGFV